MERAKVDLKHHLDASRVINLTARTKDETLVELVDAVAASGGVTDRDALLTAVRDREKLLSTGIGLGIAIPHARIPSVSEFVVAVGRQPEGIEFGSIDSKPVHIAVLIAGPQDAQQPYLELLAQLSKRLKLEEVRATVIGDSTPEEVVELLVASS